MVIDYSVTGKTKLLGLIGNPVEHSISPQLHNSLSKILGLDLIYVPLRVDKEDLETLVKALKATEFVGFNVTVPYKREIMKFLDGNTKEAILMGSVNTVKKIDGRLYGYNTDGEGFLRAFKEAAGTDFKGKKVVMLGAGGAARPIAVKIALEGAEKISLVNRTTQKSVELAEVVNENIAEIVQVYNFEDKTLKLAFEESDIIINTTSVGMSPDIDNSLISDTSYFNGQIVYDIIYNPVKTKFLADAESRGCKIINGLGMLFYQGINAYEIWTGVKISEEILRDLYNSFITILNN
ncbi:shikimate dehydrogenase [Acetivibrio clariflavus]|uniref:Shikimate dehydrogenase (NADP(+)) n=1 Tax=Acetivibrio clariflavus (strain DSM 19732 / NBRC 101661 / EBR45) TaxID=720554 RepID=G8M0G2_ACECE|nr:shikimate dehydrogenase [Acetivibrio clariflavus]AEV68007.1 shikimate dehydrogenase [Acetivibrio clariflavus DSM 19732]